MDRGRYMGPVSEAGLLVWPTLERTGCFMRLVGMATHLRGAAMRRGRLFVLGMVLVAGGCATTSPSQFVTVNGVPVPADDTVPADVPVPPAPASATIPTADDAAARLLVGNWLIDRNGTHICDIELLDRNASGVYRTKTRSCASIDLARVAIWTVVGSDLTLYDFERRLVVSLKPVLQGYQGRLVDGSVLNLKRL